MRKQKNVHYFLSANSRLIVDYFLLVDCFSSQLSTSRRQPYTTRVDLLAKQASSSCFTGPEPSVGISTSTVRSSISSWAIQEQSRLWQALPKCRQAKLFMNTPDKGLVRFALSLEKKDLRILVGLLTGHVDLNRHLKIMGLCNEVVCPLCQDEEETSIHFVAQCSATMLL